MERSDSGVKRLQSLYHSCGSKVVSINGTERTEEELHSNVYIIETQCSIFYSTRIVPYRVEEV